MKEIFTRQRIITSILALVIVYLALHFAGVLSSDKKEKSSKVKDVRTNVAYQVAEQVSTAASINSSGTIEAKNKIDIVSRIQGVFEPGTKAYRSGTYFREGETLIRVDNSDYAANMRASKAQLLQSITSVLADLKFDFPESFNKWENYVANFDVNKSIDNLPSLNTGREKAFINSKNIVSQYYSIKALEVTNNFYTIRAPYNGILSQSLVNPGTLINVGQKLGTFIDPSVYELEIKLNSNEVEKISVGKKVKLTSVDSKSVWQGKVSRINKIIDPSSQSVLGTIVVRGKNLREGMYLNADISTAVLDSVIPIARKLINDNKYVFTIKDSTLMRTEVEVIHLAEKVAYVRGISEGTRFMSSALPGAYDGMLVNPIK